MGIVAIYAHEKCAAGKTRLENRPAPTKLASGLNYYGYRYYDSNVGRFLNRDPIEEAGGFNLFAWAWNDGVNHYDYLGLTTDGHLDGADKRTPEEIQKEIDRLRKELACECDKKKKRALLKKIEKLNRSKGEANRTTGKKGQHGSDKGNKSQKGGGSKPVPKTKGDPFGQGAQYMDRNKGTAGRRPLKGWPKLRGMPWYVPQPWPKTNDPNKSLRKELELWEKGRGEGKSWLERLDDIWDHYDDLPSNPDNYPMASCEK